MKRYNACIQFISSRDKCLKKALGTLFHYFNKKYQYPVFVYYFDDVYSDPKYRKDIHESISKNIHFVNVPYKVSFFLEEKDLYHNRTDLEYVQKNFPPSRKGYLHMCNFNCNMYTYINSHLYNFDYVINLDDEGGFVKDVPFDVIEKLESTTLDMAAFITGQRLKNGGPHQGHLDTRIKLWETTRQFILENNLYQGNLGDLQGFEDPNIIHYLEFSDSYVFNTRIFKTTLWEKWISLINASGGIYKYRWGDNEIFSIFSYLYHGCPMYDLGLVRDGYYDQGKFRHLQSVAPGVKN